jgi:hypothetical protein
MEGLLSEFCRPLDKIMPNPGIVISGELAYTGSVSDTV